MSDRTNVSLKVLAGLACFLFLSSAQSAELRSAEEILRSYAEDFQSDPAAAEPITFGIKVSGEGGGEWHVVVGGKKAANGDYQVDLVRGLPPNPAAFYTLSLAALRKIDSGEINALTAMGRARASDTAPMDIGLMDGFEPAPDFFGRLIPFTFHFWTRGVPEIVNFGRPQSREVHGANMVIFYYQEGLRSAPSGPAFASSFMKPSMSAL